MLSVSHIAQVEAYEWHNKKKMKQKVAIHAVPWRNTRRYLGSIMEEELKRFIFNWTICFVYSYEKLAATQFLPFKLPF